MARDFDSASSQRLTGTNPVSGTPCTMACWFNVEKASADPEINTNISLIGVEEADANTDILRLRIRHTDTVASAMQLSAQHFDGTNATADTSTGLMSYGTWYHGCAVFASDSSRTVYLDGGNSVTESTVQAAVSGINTLGIRFFDWSPTLRQHMEGMIAEAAIWNVALTAAEVAILALGVSPLLVRPEGLVFYLPMIRDEDRDVIGGISMTAENTPTVGDHPRVFWSSPRPAYTPRKTPGPYCADVAGMFVPTTAAGGDYIPGAILGQTFITGPVAGEVGC